MTLKNNRAPLLELELELENSLFDTYKYTYIIYEKEHVIEEATQAQSGD